MTRNREIDCEDLLGCDHALAIPISQDGEIVMWRCVCGEKSQNPTIPAVFATPACGLLDDTLEKASLRWKVSK
jgi:hypothetical protein